MAFFTGVWFCVGKIVIRILVLWKVGEGKLSEVEERCRVPTGQGATRSLEIATVPCAAAP